MHKAEHIKSGISKPDGTNKTENSAKPLGTSESTECIDMANHKNNSHPVSEVSATANRKNKGGLKIEENNKLDFSRMISKAKRAIKNKISTKGKRKSGNDIENLQNMNQLPNK